MASLFSRTTANNGTNSKPKPSNLAVESSASPSFPSPSSSFVPPPESGEYSVVAVNGSLDNDNSTPTSPAPFLAPPSPNVPSQPTNGVSYGSINGKTPDGRPNSFTISPLAVYTDTSLSVAKSKHFSTPVTPTMINALAPIPQPLSSASDNPLSPRLSIASTRPAPSSPTPSRHPSLKRRKSSSRRQSTLSNTASPSQRASSGAAIASSISPQPAKRRSLVVKVRDFAFAATDERHLGIYPANRESVSSQSSSSSRPGFSRGWSGLFGAAANKFGFGFGGNSRRSSQAQQDDDSDDDSQSDDVENNEEYLEPEEGIYPDQSAALVPGLYRALYPFEAEGSSEMSLEEGQTVKVLGRGGGAGWAVVDVDGTGKQALVPEGYLELVSLAEEAQVDSDGRETPTTPSPAMQQ